MEAEVLFQNLKTQLISLLKFEVFVFPLLFQLIDFDIEQFSHFLQS